jgi:hypothetical protein
VQLTRIDEDQSRAVSQQHDPTAALCYNTLSGTKGSFAVLYHRCGSIERAGLQLSLSLPFSLSLSFSFSLFLSLSLSLSLSRSLMSSAFERFLLFVFPFLLFYWYPSPCCAGSLQESNQHMRSLADAEAPLGRCCRGCTR